MFYPQDPVDDFDGSDLRKFVNQVQDGIKENFK